MKLGISRFGLSFLAMSILIYCGAGRANTSENTTIRWLVTPRFLQAYSFSEGLASVQDYNTEKFGYIDHNGKMAISSQYDSGGEFSEGLASVLINGLRGYVNKNGEPVIKCSFNEAGPFHDGLAVVKSEGKYYFINKKGENAFNKTFEWAADFSEGVALVTVKGLRGYINTKGTFIVEPRYDDICGSFSGGLAWVIKNGKYGYIDKNGKEVIEAKFDRASNFSEGFAVVSIKSDDAVINLNGEITIAPVKGSCRFIDPSGFHQGLCAVKPLMGFYYYIDRTGIIAIKNKIITAGIFKEGLSAVKVFCSNKEEDMICNNWYSFIDMSGSIIIKTETSSIDNFSEGFAAVRDDKTYKWGYIIHPLKIK